MRRTSPWAALLVALHSQPCVAQGPESLVVTVTSAATQMPVSGAVVRSVRLRRAERSDRLGIARFSRATRPDTLIVNAVGFHPDTVIVEVGVLEVGVHLLPRAMMLADLTVSADRTTILAPSRTGAWVMPGAAVRNMPAAVEPDPFRALAIVPAVTFSTPFSARPVIRGYDANESVIRLDGFEILNPYHIGRIFSSFPTDATESVAVTPIPTSSADGGTLAGIVDLRGRNVVDGSGVGGGLAVSLVSATGWLGTAAPIPFFVAGRATYLEPATDLISESGIPYNFQDLYGHARIPLGTKRSWDLSVYASRDDFADVQAGTGMEWSNVLLGNRWRLVDKPGVSVDATASVNDFALEGVDIEARNSRIDISNTFSRVTLGFSADLQRGGAAVRGGGAIGWRRITNGLVVRRGDDFVPSANESRLVDFQGFVDVLATGGSLSLSGGVRIDASDVATTWQPRARLSALMSQRLSVAVTFARASRLYQLITDPQPEPSISFYDFWFNAGEQGVPVPYVNHIAAEIDRVGRSWSMHAAAYISKGNGLGELRPIWDQRAGSPPFRYGESRTHGLEFRAAWRPGVNTGPSGALTYVWSNSERRWDGTNWRPWRLDRRHNVRLQIDAVVGSRWYLFAISEFSSGQPITPPKEVVRPESPILAGDSSSVRGLLRYLYGQEGVGRSAGTVRLDFGARVQLNGPGDSRISVGLSVINLGFGPVAPEVPVEPFELIRSDGSFPSDGVQYKRLFSLPAVPSITARIEF